MDRVKLLNSNNYFVFIEPILDCINIPKLIIESDYNISLTNKVKDRLHLTQWFDILTRDKDILSHIDFYREFNNHIDFRLYNYSAINFNDERAIDLFDAIKNKVNWSSVSAISNLNLNFISHFEDCVDWEYISRYQKLTEDFIREYNKRVNWYYISRSQQLSEDFIDEFKDDVHWRMISNFQKLSEGFIRKYADKVDWDMISSKQVLGEDFIHEYADKLNWDKILKTQKISPKFKKEHSKYIDNLMKNKESFSLSDLLTSSATSWTPLNRYVQVYQPTRVYEVQDRSNNNAFHW